MSWAVRSATMLGVILGCTTSWAAPKNLRDSCRREIAGWYLAHFDALRQKRALVTELNQQMVKLRAAHTTATRKLAEYESAALQKPFDANHMHTLYQEQSRVTLLQQRLDENTSILSALTSDIEAAEARDRTIVASMHGLVAIATTDDHHGEAYPAKIDFVAPCPRFHFRCPLPKDHAARLQTLFAPDPTPESCMRFAMMRPIQDPSAIPAQTHAH